MEATSLAARPISDHGGSHIGSPEASKPVSSCYIAAMIDQIAQHRDQLRDICRRYGVRKLDLFGSAARDDFDPKHSDVDFLVEFDLSRPEALSLDTYLSLKEALESVLGRKVDLLEAGAVQNPYLRADIERSRTPVFAA